MQFVKIELAATNVNRAYDKREDDCTMKVLSDRTRAVIDRLYPHRNRAYRLLGGPHSPQAAIEELGNCGEAAAIPYLAPLLGYGDPHEVLAAARSIAVLLSHTSVEDLAWLDEQMRASWGFTTEYSDHWRALAPRELAKWVGPGEPGIVLLQLASFHGNGFVREAAVRRLSLVDDGGEVAYLLLRLNDWVPQVRQAARDAVRERIRADYIPHFIKSLPLLARLQKMTRGDHHDLLEGIQQLLAQPAARAPMIAAMHAPSLATRRASIRLLLAGTPADLEPVLLAALQVADPVVRLWSVRKAADTLGEEQLLRVLERFTNDPAAVVRREALRIWANAFPDKAVDKLTAALLHPSRSVRAEARYQLGQHGGRDFAQFYQNALTAQDATRLSAAISGLAETGGQADAASFAPYLSHPSAKVRRAVVTGVMKLGGDQYVDVVLDRILDPAPGVSLQAWKLLKPYAGTIGATKLWALFEEPGWPYVRRNLLRLLTALSKWDSISCLLQAATDRDEKIAAQALEHVHRWNAQYNRRQTMPSRDQLGRLQAVLRLAESRLVAKDLAEIRFAVQTFSTY